MTSLTMKTTQREKVWSSWPEFDEEQIAAATQVLQSGRVNYWTGEEGKNFEQEFAEFVDCKYAIAVSNGTVALELALYSLGIGPGDEVIVPSRTFIATASAVVARGATPVCADVDLQSQNLTVDTIAEKITAKTKAIIAVHLAGWPCDMTPIVALANKHSLFVIEDCAQAHGARYKNQPIGSLGDVAAFSFCQDKIMTTAGEGGMLVTNSKDIWQKAWSYKDHGKSYDTVFNKEHPPGFRWLHESFGTNMRLSEVQSAIGRVALRRLPEWIETRRSNAKILSEQLSKCFALDVPLPNNDIYHSYYKYYAFVKPEFLKTDWCRDRILQEISSRGVPCFSGSCSEIYLEKAFPHDMKPQKPLPQARQLGETSIMFQVDPTISADQMHKAASIAMEILGQASISSNTKMSA